MWYIAKQMPPKKSSWAWKKTPRVETNPSLSDACLPACLPGKMETKLPDAKAHDTQRTPTQTRTHISTAKCPPLLPPHYFFSTCACCTNRIDIEYHIPDASYICSSLAGRGSVGRRRFAHGHVRSREGNPVSASHAGKGGSTTNHQPLPVTAAAAIAAAAAKKGGHFKGFCSSFSSSFRSGRTCRSCRHRRPCPWRGQRPRARRAFPCLSTRRTWRPCGSPPLGPVTA